MAALQDRRRLNGPAGDTAPPVFSRPSLPSKTTTSTRTRLPGELRKIFLKTGLVPSASGSAYLELQPSRPPTNSQKSGLKLACTVHGPRPLARFAPFSPQLILTTRVKFAPFSTRDRNGYVPDANERDLTAHLETALRGVLLAERWPKSGLDVIITVLEGEEDLYQVHGAALSECSLMSILSGCITVASAAIAEAGVDCVDLITGGVAALVSRPSGQSSIVLDPCLADGDVVQGLCVVAYLQSRDEVTEVWSREEQSRLNAELRRVISFEDLVNNAIEAASAARLVLIDALKEGVDA